MLRIMKKLIFKIIRLSGLPYLFRTLVQKNKVTILVYHEMTPEVAEKNFLYLIKNYNIISLQDFFKAHQSKNQQLLPKNALVITFDDGRKSNFQLLPLIKKHKIPVTIFLNSGIIGTNRHYWFRFKQEKYTNEELKKLSNKERLKRLEDLGFKQEKEFDTPWAMNKEEIMEMNKWVNMQSHTVFHPILPKCDDQEASFEIINCRSILEKEYGFSINALAYPNGDYSIRDIEIAKNAGFKFGLTTKKGFNSIHTDPFKLRRLDPDDTSNLDELIVKSSGVLSLFG